MAGVSLIFSTLIMILARADGEYNYQPPGASFQLLNQQYVQGRPPENIQQAQHISSPFQQAYIPSSHSNIQRGHLSNQFSNQGSSFASSNQYQGYVQNGNGISQSGQLAYQNNINHNSAAPVQPNIMKHIYFHVPPPDVEASVSPVQYKKKKSYNIVFIKVPSQRPRYFINSQGFVTNPYVPVEKKTVIYVLVRKPEDQQQVRANSRPSHEVFYVKYKGNADGAAAQINNQLSGDISEPSLLPGLVNGRQ